MDGIVNILKPPGMTSFDVVAIVRRTLKQKKVGHTGTLDPDAVGVLPVCLGKATRMVELLMEDHKFYRAEVTLGIETDSEDSTGEVVCRHEVGQIEQSRLEAVLDSFCGTIQQVPPMVSAVKHEGRRLYELARKGIEVEREAREVQIHSLKLLRVDLPRFWIDVECSKGTYIRTLAKDIGDALGVGAHLSYLIRTGTGEFTLLKSVTLEEMVDAAARDRVENILLPIDWGIRSMPKAVVHAGAQKKAVNGAQVQCGDYLEFPEGVQQGDKVRLYSPDSFVAIAEVVELETQVLQPVKVFA